MKKKILLIIALLIPFTVGNAKSFADKITELSTTDTVNFRTDDPDHNLRYVGANPNNYVSFNGELWRIIGVFDGRVKIIRATYLRYNDGTNWAPKNYAIDKGTMPDLSDTYNNSDGINEWSQTQLMRELNGDYINSSLKNTDPGYFRWYANSWKYLDGNDCRVGNDQVLDERSVSLIDEVTWHLGAGNNDNGTVIDTQYPNDNPLKAAKLYELEKSNNTGRVCTNGGRYCNDPYERHTSWTGKVGLMYASDYVYATTGSSSYTREQCLNTALFRNGTNYANISDNACRNNNWLYKSENGVWGDWTITPAADPSSAGQFFYVDNGGQLYQIRSQDVYGVRPVVYLNPNVSFTSGTGTEDDPFIPGDIEEPTTPIDPSDPTNPDDPKDPSNPSDDGTDDRNPEVKGEEEDFTNPQTGVNNNLLLPLAIILGLFLLLRIVSNKKSIKKF